MKKCPDCHGYGFHTEWWADGKPEGKRRECDTCHGSGKVPKAAAAPVKQVCQECAQNPPFTSLKMGQASYDKLRCDLCGQAHKGGILEVPEEFQHLIGRDAKKYREGLALDRMAKATWLHDQEWRVVSIERNRRWDPVDAPEPTYKCELRPVGTRSYSWLTVHTDHPLEFEMPYSFGFLRRFRCWLSGNAVVGTGGGIESQEEAP